MDVLIAVAAVLLGFVVRHFAAPYFGEKAKNLATKQDIGEITTLVESAKADFSRDIELLRWQLTKKANIHRIVAEREIQAVFEVGSALFDLRLATTELRPVMDSVPSDGGAANEMFQKRFTNWAEMHNAFFVIVEKQRLFLPKSIYNMLCDIKGKAVEEGVSFETDLRLVFDGRFTFEQHQQASKRIGDLLAAINHLCDTVNERYEIEGLSYEQLAPAEQ